MQQLRAKQLADWLSDADRPAPLLLDVREPWEYELCHIDGSHHVPMHLIPVRCAELAPDRDTVVICHHGARSFQVAMFLESRGFGAIHNLMGGVEAWATEVAPQMRRY